MLGAALLHTSFTHDTASPRVWNCNKRRRISDAVEEMNWAIEVHVFSRVELCLQTSASSPGILPIFKLVFVQSCVRLCRCWSEANSTSLLKGMVVLVLVIDFFQRVVTISQ